MLNFLKKLFTSNKLYQDIDSENFRNLITNNAIILDVRTPNEFKSGKILNAININVASFDYLKKVAGLDKNKSILVYCKSGGRSAQAAKMITKLGFKKVYNLTGGILAWQKQGNKLSH